MRPVKRGAEVGVPNLMEKQSLAAAKELWDAWEIHFLILTSLFLQVSLFLFAGMRRRSSSLILRTVLWLAYLSADAVAIFVLGHLAVHASEPRHQLMSFWAPFVLVHLGGQDTITAFSKQDNELWRRHLLSLVTQVAVAGYVVAKASWPDGRLKAAMVIMFLSGAFKYAERTLCLYMSSPESLRKENLKRWSLFTRGIGHRFHVWQAARDRISEMSGTLDRMLKGGPISFHDVVSDELGFDESVNHDIMSVDAPLNRVHTILVADELSGMLAEFLSSANRRRAYEFVGAWLVNCYQLLYTKFPLRMDLHGISRLFICSLAGRESVIFPIFISIPILLYSIFYYVSTPIALVLFIFAQKGNQLHASRADITVSYILIIAAIVLDVSSAIRLIFSDIRFTPPARILHRNSYIQPAWCRRQWSEELAQCSMIKRHTVQDTTGMASIRQWFGRRLGAWGVELLDITEVPITEDHVPIKEFILDNLLRFGIRKQWNIASSRGHLALQKWISTHHDPDYASRAGKKLEKSINVDFPTSVLIWHIATDICYYLGDKTSAHSDQTMADMQISRKLSNYIMYLVFKCGVMLSPNSQVLYDKAYDEISEVLSAHQGQQVALAEKVAIRKLFEAIKDSQVEEIQKHEEPADDNNDADQSHLHDLLQTARALDSPVLPRARELAQELISIDNETDRWELIAAVWAEMLYYTAPRCGGAFHYEHLSTGGEFITHVLLLMYFLGPFLPPPSASAS
ncbi:hypothetical protein EJB05_24347, partial [Eragrostis curvula]